MTVSTTSSRIVFSGNGSNTSFPAGFRVDQAADLVVTFTDANGNDTVLTTGQYTTDGQFGSVYPNGPTVTYNPGGTPIASGTKLTLQRVIATTQPTQLNNQGALWPAVVEAAFDRVVMIVQGFIDAANRALRIAATDGTTLNVLPAAAQRANGYLGFDGSGQPTVLAAPAGSSPISVAMAAVVDQATLALARTAMGAVGPADNNAFVGTNTHSGPETFTGTVDVTGGRSKVPTRTAGDNGTDSASTAFVQAAGTVTASAAHGAVNALRNSTFLSWPNGFTPSVVAGAGGSAAIGANGWAVLATGAAVAVSQVAGTGASASGMKVTGAASVTDVTIGQRIESFDAAPLAGNTCTFQIRVFNSTGASITPTLATRYAGSADTWGAPVADLAATNLQACPNGQWTTVAYTFAVSANAVNGYEIKIDFGNNFSTNGKFVTVAGADLRPTVGLTTGLNAAPPAIEVPATGPEMLRNARYYQASYDNGVAPGAATRASIQDLGGPNGTGATNGFGFSFPARMRTAPTLAFWDGAGNSGKSSRYNAGAWVDNAGTLATVASGAGSAVLTTTDTTNIQYFAHYTAYADFW